MRVYRQGSRPGPGPTLTLIVSLRSFGLIFCLISDLVFGLVFELIPSFHWHRLPASTRRYKDKCQRIPLF
jgi:hypothetical protein